MGKEKGEIELRWVKEEIELNWVRRKISVGEEEKEKTKHTAVV